MNDLKVLQDINSVRIKAQKLSNSLNNLIKKIEKIKYTEYRIWPVDKLIQLNKLTKEIIISCDKIIKEN